MHLSTTQDQKQLVRDFFQAVSERHEQDFTLYLAPDVIDHNQIIFGEERRPGAAFEGLRQQLAAFDPLTVTVEDLICEGDQVVARVRQSGVHSGSHPRMPKPTGKPFEVEAIWMFTIRSGLISQIRAISDRLGLFLQLGWDWPRA